MQNSLSPELYWLASSTLMTSLLWIPYILNRMHEQGIFNALWDRFGDTSTHRKWAQRMMDAHKNAVENLAVFAPLVLLIEISGSQSPGTAMACMIYFYARLVHYLVFTFALPLLRVISFLVGFAVQVYLAIHVLNI